jgi:Domain of unknown function (DUF4430)
MNEAKNVEPSAATKPDDAPRFGSVWWRLPLLLTVVLVALIAARATRVWERTAVPRDSSSPSASAEGKSVSLVLRFDEGNERQFDDVAWRHGMTIDDLMTDVSRRPNGPMYRISGDGQMAFVVGIDEAINGDGGGKFWTYQVNDVPGDRSFAVVELQPGDRVLWTFGSQR